MVGKSLNMDGIDEAFNITHLIIEKSTTLSSEIAYILGYNPSKSGPDHRAYNLIKYNLKQEKIVQQIK